MTKKDLADMYADFHFGNQSGFGTMFSESMHDEVHKHLGRLDSSPITKVQLNQLFVISQAGSMSDGFFQYYWNLLPNNHPYYIDVSSPYQSTWTTAENQIIFSHDHLRWGLKRFYIDGLFFFGNIVAAFNSLRSMTLEELDRFYADKCFDTQAISARGPALPLENISKDDRYLISEMACKTFGEVPEDAEVAKAKLRQALSEHNQKSQGKVTFKKLFEQPTFKDDLVDQLLLSYDGVLEEEVADTGELDLKFEGELNRFIAARSKAIQNTALYLSMVNDLDVYVATSMRNRQNFRDMADACETIFQDNRLKELHLRYFDPTMSAAEGHEDKGLIECLMVKCAKVLVYCEGEKESYGKDAEAAMALSLGKPVIFYCDHGKKTNFYRDVHPLARLINFRTGVAVGAIVTDDVSQVAELLHRIYKNRMEYRVEHHPKRKGYLKLVEQLTGSVVRLQTDNELLAETFWNNYHRSERPFVSLASGKEAERMQE